MPPSSSLEPASRTSAIVRNSLPMRSSLDVGGKAWVLKAEVGGGDDESDKKGDDDGLNRQRCEVLSIP